MIVDIGLSVFNAAYIPHLDNMSRTQIFFGGSASGKSVFNAQRDIVDILQGGRNFLVCRQVARTIRRSVFAEIVKIISAWGLGELFKINKSEMIITCANGYQFLFAGLDDVEKLKSITPDAGVITDVRIEEATEAHESSVKQLRKRQRGGDSEVPKRLVMSFNPVIKTHWIYNEYFKALGWADDQTEYNGHELSILKTTYKNNRFLTDGDIADLEDESDKYYHDVYTLGNWGVLGNLIFKNWTVRDLTEERKTFGNFRDGLDFGFGVAPSAFNTTHYNKNRKGLYIIDEFNGLELTNDILAEMIRPKISNRVLYCDSAEPKSIKELQILGIRAMGAKKGKGSIEHGIKWLQQQEIIIDSACIHTQNEFSLYSWKQDKYGETLPVPRDAHNHHIDELRYQYEDMAYENVTIRNNLI